MKKIAKIALVLGAFLFVACDDNSNKKAQTMPPSLVDIKPIVKEDANIYYQFASKLEANKQVAILPKVSGEIKDILFKDGDFVKAGTVLYKIDDEQYKANLDLSLADVAVARASYENAKTDYNRTKDLYNKKAVSKKEYDSKLALYKSAKAGLSKANAAYKLAKLNYDYTNVTAPFDGYLQSSLVDKGSFAAANNTKLVEIVDQDTIKAVFYISDSNMEQIKNNQNDLKKSTAKFVLNGKEYKGSMEFVANLNELASIKAYAVFDNSSHDLNAGSFVNLKLDDIKQKDSFVIKKENLLQDIDGYFVYIKDKNKVKQVHVKPIFDDEKFAVIDPRTSDLKENELLILNNYKKIYPGANVATDAEFAEMMKMAQQNKANKDK